MIVEELAATFEKFEREFLKFSRIKNPPSKRPDLCAFLLLDKLCPGNGDIIAASEHDEFYLSIDIKALAKAATEDDILYLCRCGIHYDESNDSLSMFA